MPERKTSPWWLALPAVLLAVNTGMPAAVAGRTDEPAAARPADPSRHADPLAELLGPIREKHSLPGLAAAIVSRGEVVALGATGVRRAGDEAALTIDDLFHIGSCTKAMTATMIAALVEDGTLSWSTTVGEVFSAIEMDDRWREVTLEQLLTNRSGAPADLNADGLWQRLWSFRGSPRQARMELVRGVLSRPPSTRGEFVYSNAGFALAGAIAEQRTDTLWEELMLTRLFAPLGIASAGFGAPGSAETLDQPRGHSAGGTPVEPGPRGDNPPAIGPAGAVHLSLADWARFIALHTHPGAGMLLAPATLEKLHAPADGPGDRYAMGWIVGQRGWAKGDGGDGRILTHAGSNTMWFAVVWIAPERDIAFLVACNQGGPTAALACDEAVGALIRHMTTRAAPPVPAPSSP
jgi:CubicO group peptidase (beta-lactamase class C family)